MVSVEPWCVVSPCCLCIAALHNWWEPGLSSWAWWPVDGHASSFWAQHPTRLGPASLYILSHIITPLEFITFLTSDTQIILTSTSHSSTKDPDGATHTQCADCGLKLLYPLVRYGKWYMLLTCLHLNCQPLYTPHEFLPWTIMALKWLTASTPRIDRAWHYWIWQDNPKLSCSIT